MVQLTSDSLLPADSLALGIVRASHAPVLLLSSTLNILASSASFETAFQFDAGTVKGRSLGDLGSGEWGRPHLHSLLTATLSGFAEIANYEMDLHLGEQEPRQLVLNAARLDHGEPHDAHLLLTIADVTAARRADRKRDAIVREKEVLLREVQHRVANSLQIIASVLMQSARKVQSEETRTELTNAHGRVMSIAAIQRQLSLSEVGDVDLKAYLTQLCSSLGASMITDGSGITLGVASEAHPVDADVSIRLGLIVTELVINALKHAFPEQQGGKIAVAYAATGAEWTLTVTDDGVGMPAAGMPGLGSGIVEALAKQLEADVAITDAGPGTRVSISHKNGGVSTTDSKLA